MLRWADRVAEATTTEGTAPFVLEGRITGFQRFAEVPDIEIGDTAYYGAFTVNSNGVPLGPWEAGLATYSALNTLTRTTVEQSSNDNAPVVFRAGTKWVILSPTASIQPSAFVATLMAAADGAEFRTLIGAGDATTAYVDDGDASTLAEAEAYADAAVAAIAGNGTGTPANGVVAGLGVIYSGTGLSWAMSAGSANINGELVDAVAQTVTLDAADATNPRLDAFYLDDTGTFGKITGTPATNPSLPTVDPTSQLYLGFALVPATATDLTSGIVTDIVYDEGAEWTGSTSGVGFTVNSTNNPNSGTKCIEGTTVANGAYVKLVRSSAISFDGDGNLVLAIRSKGSWNNKRSLTLRWYLAGVAKGSPVTLKQGSFAFASADTSVYQTLVISKTLFSVPSGTNVDELRIAAAGSGGPAIGFYIDPIKLQTLDTGSGGTGGGGTTNGITQEQGDARYVRLAGVSAIEATLPQVFAGTSSDAVITPKISRDAQVPVALTSSATITPNFNSGFNFALTLAHNATLANPTNAQSGDSGVIFITQDGTGSRTLAYGTDWDFPAGTPTLQTDPGDVDVLCYLVKASGQIICSMIQPIAVGGGGDMLAANNLSDVASAATSRTNLGATTVGGNVFTLTNPSAITFPRFNADNSVSALSASAFRTAIGAGVGGGDLVSTNNLSDLTNAGTARTNLGLAIGTNVQAYSANLTTYAGIAPSANVQTLLGAANYAAFRTSLAVNTRTIVISLTGTALTASEVLDAIMPPTGETWTFPANLSTSSGKKLSGGVNPASTETIDLVKNGSSVASIIISTSGVVTFATSGGTSFSLTGGTDVLVPTGPASPDAAVGYVFTLVATWA